MKRTISVIICGLVILSSLVFATGCGRSSHDVDLSKYVKFDGFSTVASLESTPDYEKCEDERDEIAEKRSDIKDKNSSKYKEYTEKIAELTDVKNALKNITFSLSKGDDGKIKNGDTITVKAKYKADQIKNFGVNIKADEFTVKVSGLEEKEVVDPFDKDHFELKVSGADGKGRVENGKGDEDISYSFDPYYDLKNGDKVTVEAYTYDDDIVLKDSTESDGSKVTKEFTISGLGTIPETLDGVDTSDVDEQLLNKLKEDFNFKKSGDKYTVEGKTVGDSKIVGVTDFTKSKGIYQYPKEDDNYSIYTRTFTNTLTVIPNADDSSKGWKKGKKAKLQLYYTAAVRYTNVMVVDNKLQIEDSDYGEIETDVFYTFNEAKDSITEFHKDSYKISTID